MKQNPNLTEKEIEQFLSSNVYPNLKLSGSKYVIFSDVHLGDGGGSDDFVHNEKIVLECLEHYKQNNFKLILLGDIEDLWQVKLGHIRKRYDDTIYKKIREFGDENVFRVYGNHDSLWGKKNENYKGDKRDPAFNDGREFGSALESIRFIDDDGNTIILLLHGHQGCTEPYMFSWIRKRIVFLFGKILEPVFRSLHLIKSNSEPNSCINGDYEQVYYRVALEKKVLLVVGHSHYAIFASLCHVDELKKEIDKLKSEIENAAEQNKKAELLKKLEQLKKKLKIEKARNRVITPTDPNLEPKPCYFNAGCCLYTYGITCIELEDDHIRLLKWSDGLVKQDYGKGSISEFYKALQS